MLKKTLKYASLVLLIAFVVAQFIRPEKNVSTAPNPHDLLAHHPAPPEVKQILAVACYDCHSNNTRYPWYAHIQPLGWWLANHVKDGKGALNFSEFAEYSRRQAKQKIETSMDEVADKNMPLPSYLWTHHDARLSPEQTEALTTWFEEVLERLEEAE